MNDIIVNRWAMGLAVFSFGFLSIGSFLFGATATTSILRGLGGGVLFGSSLWLAGLLVNEEKDAIEGDSGAEVNTEAESTQESVEINPEAVRENFLKKSAKIAEKDAAQKAEEKEEKYNEEATPF